MKETESNADLNDFAQKLENVYRKAIEDACAMSEALERRATIGRDNMKDQPKKPEIPQ